MTRKMTVGWLPFDLQLRAWGYALSGEGMGDVLDFAACISEGNGFDERAWDRDQSYLSSIRRLIDSKSVAPRNHWALPWVVEAEFTREFNEAVGAVLEEAGAVKAGSEHP